MQTICSDCGQEITDDQDWKDQTYGGEYAIYHYSFETFETNCPEEQQS